MSIPEYASPSATAEFAQRQTSSVQQHGFTRLGRTDLLASRLGFGTYRCHSDIQQHKDAIRLALQSGCNLFDTSANYTDGNAEVLIGDLLNEEVVWGERAREELIIVSKAGYIQGENMEIALAREGKEEPFPEVVKYQNGLWHCIHPEFLEDQITRTLARMHLDTLDVYLLHNPEYFLSHAMQQGIDSQTASKQFYDRIRKAFVQMEDMVSEGLIRWYGISSNGFSLSAGSVNAVNLDLVWRAYQDVCLQKGLTPEEGHFAVIQVPFNWIEKGAATYRSSEKQQTVLELAQSLDLAVLANRPLNAIENNQLVRLSNSALNERTTKLRAGFDKANPKFANLTMSQKALSVCRSMQGIDVVLNGMRTPDYVKDSMGIAGAVDVNVTNIF
ncbi:MAG: aldo/keto reductase [Calditrichia bacterium]